MRFLSFSKRCLHRITYIEESLDICTYSTADPQYIQSKRRDILENQLALENRETNFKASYHEMYGQLKTAMM